VAVSSKHLTTLVELSYRRQAPQSADLQRALHMGRAFEAEPSTPVALRSLAWRVITDSHRAAGWGIPEGDRFPACCGAAASARHGSALLIQEIAGQLAAIEGRVVLLGALAASRSVFGDWSILPTTGAFLVPLDATSRRLPQANVYHGAVGVRWGAAGELSDVFERHTTPAELAGLEVLVPRPELIAARTAGCSEDAASLECLIFCGAAYATTRAGRWRDTRRIAPRLGTTNTPLEAAYRLGIDQWLGIAIPAPKRALFAVRRLLGSRGRAA
jgi:hypothetical protein